MLEHYRNANLIPLLETIRRPGRYAELDGVNVLTNAAFDGTYNKEEATRELGRADGANHADFVPEFSNPKQGFAYGLNPYTDWSLAQLKAPPTHYYLFLGLDWYPISGLGKAGRWFDCLHNPFEAIKDRYWHNVWAWILRKHRINPSGRRSWDTPIEESDAAVFIRADGGAFIFHNLIPYLRPAGSKGASTAWYDAEWKKTSVSHDVIEDLRLLRSLAERPIVAFCTGKRSVNALVDAGYEPQKVHSWKAHPSRVFHASRFVKEDFWFRGRDYLP